MAHCKILLLCFFLLLSVRSYLYDLDTKSVLDDWQTFSVWRDILNKNHIVCVCVCVCVCMRESSLGMSDSL